MTECRPVVSLKNIRNLTPLLHSVTPGLTRGLLEEYLIPAPFNYTIISLSLFAIYFYIVSKAFTYSVYILSNFTRTAFYIGVTNDLVKRIRQHRFENGSIFTSKYKCFFLMYFEEYKSIRNAISREKQLKNWERKWKIELIKKENPEMKDLAEQWV